MLIVVTVLLSDFIPLRDRGTYQGYLNLIGAVGSTSGGPIGLPPAQVHSYDRKLTFRLKEGFLYKALAGDGKQWLAPMELPSLLR